MMKIFKILLIVFVSVAFTNDGQGQQMARRTQFMQNPYFINPAYAGTKLYSPIRLSYRNQWTGFHAAPVTYMLSGHFSMPNNFGAGINIVRDETGGAITNTQVEVSAAYSMDLNSSNAFSIGFSALVNQFVFDGTDMKLLDQNDPVIFGGTEQRLNIDGSFGVMVYGEGYYLGLSVPQFLQSKYKLDGETELTPNKNVRHVNFIASYQFEMTDNVKFIPSLLIKYIFATPPQIDFAGQLKFNDTFWFGAGYRHKDALTATVGLHYNNFIISYAYDFTISDASLFSPHTHEATVGYNIQRKNSQFNKKKLSKRTISRKSKVK